MLEFVVTECVCAPADAVAVALPSWLLSLAINASRPSPPASTFVLVTSSPYIMYPFKVDGPCVCAPVLAAVPDKDGMLWVWLGMLLVDRVTDAAPPVPV